MKTLKDRWYKLNWEHRLLVFFTFLAFLPAILAFWPEASKNNERSAPTDVTTHIPRGFVLIPIEIQNYQALDSILGRFGVVDLFTSQGERSGKPLARNVRLLRAPHNPSQFAALVPESQAEVILAPAAPLTAVIKHTQSAGTEIVNLKPKTRRTIVYGGG